MRWEKLDDGANTLNGGMQEFNSQLQKMPDAANQLDQGAGKLQDGAQQLNTGLNTAADGSKQLASGLGELQAGTDKLGDGASQVAGGVDKIAGVAGAIGTAQAAVSDIDANLANVIADLDASPIPGTQPIADQARAIRVQLNNNALTAVAGSDLVSQLMQLQAGAHEVANQLQNPNATYRSGVDKAAAASLQLADGLAKLQDGSGTLLAGMTELKNGTSQLVVAAHTASDASSKLADGSGQLVVGLVASWSFITTIFALNTLFGVSVGRLITMALMSLQLVASNGLYPPEVQPEFIQWVHKLDPMTYVVDLTRFALFGTSASDPRMHRAVVVLVGLAVGSWLISCVGLRSLRRPREKDIYPEISV